MNFRLANWLTKHKEETRSKQIAASDARGVGKTTRERPVGDPEFYSIKQLKKCFVEFDGEEMSFCDVAQLINVSVTVLIRFVKIDMHNNRHNDLSRAVNTVAKYEHTVLNMRSKSMQIEYDGKMVTVEELAKQKGITMSLLLYRLNNGFSVLAAIDEAVLPPVYCKKTDQLGALQT